MINMIKEQDVSVGQFYCKYPEDEVAKYPFDARFLTVQIIHDLESERFGVSSISGFVKFSNSFSDLVKYLNDENLRKLAPHEIHLILSAVTFR